MIKKVFIHSLLMISVLICGCSESSEEPIVPEEPDIEQPTQEIVSKKYIPIDWEKTQLISSDYNTGVFELSKTSDTEKLTKGSVMTIVTDTSYCIAIVTDIVNNNNYYRIKSVKGNLCDIFANTEIVLSTSDDSSRNATNTSYCGKTQYYQDGKWNDLVKSRESSHFTGNIWNWSDDKLEGNVLFKKGNFEISLDKCKFDIDVDLTLKLNFSGRDSAEFVSEGVKVYRSRMLKAETYIEGNFTTIQKLAATGNGKLSYKEKEDEMFIHNVFPPLRKIVMLGTVPVEILINADMYRGASIETEGRFKSGMGYEASITGKLGVCWEQEKNSFAPIHDLSTNLTTEYPYLSGNMKTSAKTWVYPRLRFILYELFGGAFDLKPYLKTEVNGGYHEQLLTDVKDYSSWSLANYLGLDADFGLSIMRWGYEVANKKLGSFNIKDYLIFHSPSDIRLINKKETYTTNNSHNLEFEVYDMNHLLKTENLTMLPQFVKFEGDGIISSTYGIAKNGVVNVTWTPKSKDDKMRAILNDVNGNIIKSVEIVSKEKDELREALIKLYKSTNGDNWTRNDNWCSDLPVEEWYGVSCSERNECTISLNSNNLTGEINQTFPNSTKIKLKIKNNHLHSLNISGCTSLELLDCSNNQLTSLNVSSCTEFKYLICSNNQLTSLNILGCKKLETLACYHNLLTSFNVSGFKALRKIAFGHNKLTSLKVTSCTALTDIDCRFNMLSSLDVSSCKNLEYLDCVSNQLTSLNILGCEKLGHLFCAGNRIISIIPEWFSQLSQFSYDERFEYWDEDVENDEGEIITITKYKDHGIGWWYPGEPQKGYHGPN